ncbi:ABC transporter permease [Nocardioides astragali]|uniref:ABC transporter permease n=1 Tax=Nocardioides astragali TaxID=1776736 RepID=A0ABW2N7I1_9ACTN|nr:ABC transporter permease subunit [Nocardioides astragali]
MGSWFSRQYNEFVVSGRWLYEPIATQLTTLFDTLLNSLTLIAAPVVVALVISAVILLRGFKLGLLALAAFAWILLTDLWQPTLETIAFMIVAVALSAAAGLMLGLLGSVNSKSDAAVRALVDVMQAFPSFAYMVPVIVLLGIGNTAALVVTIIWAAPPLARMTSVGLRSVSPDTVEAAVATGASRRRVLFGVKLPMASHSIQAGFNQTIMYAIAMATMAAMIGASGLGVPVWGGLGRLAFGDALEGGIALVFVAILLDRISAVHPAGSDRSGFRPSRSKRRLVVRAATAAALTVGTVAATVALRGPWQDFDDPPWDKVISLRGPIESLIEWLNTTWGEQFDAFQAFVQELGLNPLGTLFTSVPWYVVVAGVALTCAVLVGRLAAVVAGVGVLLIGVLGMWTSAAETLAVITTAIGLVLVVAFPLGVLMSMSDRVEACFKPILDVMQTLPVYLFVIPAVIFLGTGEVAGTIATFIAASPPMMRYTNAALRNVDPEVVEASVMAGASPWQVLTQVRIPLGLPTLMVGLNQAVLLAMAMAVVTAFIGSPGLGQDILYSLQRFDLARGIEGGLAMLLVAVIIDRVFQGAARMLSTVTHTSEERIEAEA